MKRTHEVEDRLNLELSMIQRMGYAAYFLTVAGHRAGRQGDGDPLRVPRLRGRARSSAT
jgi:hypothetical protein